MATYDVTALDSALEFDATLGKSTSIVRLTGTNKVAIAWNQSTTLFYVMSWMEGSAEDGFVRSFQVTMPVTTVTGNFFPFF